MDLLAVDFIISSSSRFCVFLKLSQANLKKTKKVKPQHRQTSPLINSICYPVFGILFSLLFYVTSDNFLFYTETSPLLAKDCNIYARYLIFFQLGLPRAFEQLGIFIVPLLLSHGASVFSVSSEGPSQLSRIFNIILKILV